MPYGLNNKFNKNVQKAMDAYEVNDFKTFSESLKSDDLTAENMAGLLEYVCAFPRSERAMAPASKLAVLFEALLTQTPKAEVVARHDALRAVNAGFEVSGAVDAILGTGKVDKIAVEAAAAATEKRGYAAAARALRFQLTLV